jgi:hypothetical protein
MDKIRLLILLVGTIVIISFSIYSFSGTTPSSQPEGTKIKPIGQITIIPSPNKNLNSYSVKNTSTLHLKSFELAPLYHYISFGTNPVSVVVESASSAPSSSMVMNIFANKDLPENYYSISFPQTAIVTHGKNPGSFVSNFQNVNTSVNLQDIPDDTNVNLYMLTVAKPNLKMLPDYKELSSNQIKIDNNRAYDIKYIWSNSSERLESLKTFIEGKDQAAVVTFSSPIQDFNKVNSTLDSVLNSFKWLGQ